MTGTGNFFKKLFGKTGAEKQDSPAKSAEPRVTSEYKSDVENFISFILKEDKENNVVLGRNDGRYFICFKNEYLKPFFSDWFALMKEFVSGALSQSTYDSSFSVLCDKYSVSSKNAKPDAEDNSGGSGEEAEQQ
ncbi:MAG: hypothetical protein LUD81_04430 [Clostridiales bacterium]|nr:hypothetical protein [Clostridiales bacterium]